MSMAGWGDQGGAAGLKGGTGGLCGPDGGTVRWGRWFDHARKSGVGRKRTVSFAAHGWKKGHYDGASLSPARIRNHS